MKDDEMKHERAEARAYTRDSLCGMGVEGGQGFGTVEFATEEYPNRKAPPPISDA